MRWSGRTVGESRAAWMRQYAVDHDIDLTKDPASAEQKGAVGKNKSRVFAFGRFSIVDYEEHYYVSQFAKPTKPPAS